MGARPPEGRLLTVAAHVGSPNPPTPLGYRQTTGLYTPFPMNRALLPGVILVLAAAGCANSASEGESASEIPVPSSLPRCDEIFARGNIIDRQTFGDSCRGADDELVVPRPAVVDCQDGRELVWNDLAWGFVGDGMQMWEPEEEERVPVDQALSCLEAPAPAGQQPASVTDTN